MSTPIPHRLGLVLSGGGARGAFEAGVIHYLRTMLPVATFRRRDVSVLCGSSVGAINACFMAATAHDPAYQGARIREIWSNLSQRDIYRRDVLSLAKFLFNSAYRVSKNVLSRQLDAPESIRTADHFKSLLNTAPLVPFLKRIIPWKQIRLNIASGAFEALSVTATNVHTGRLELFIEKHKDLPYTGHYVFHEQEIEHEHAMASGAIPMVFPSVKIGGAYYVDGGLRLNTPLSPAIQLGADQILVVGPHHEDETAPEPAADKKRLAPPSLGSVAGKIMSTIFVDKLGYDIEQLTRINRLIEWGEGAYGADFVAHINGYLKANGIRGDIANRGLKKLKVVKILPSVDPEQIFSHCIARSDFLKKGLTSFERTLLKILDVDLESGGDFLSFILFYPEYLKELFALGFEDAKRRHDDLLEFFS